jgi:hypothetical protein
MNRHRRRTIPPGSLVHVAARQRGEPYWSERLPENPVWTDNQAPADPPPATEDRP